MKIKYRLLTGILLMGALSAWSGRFMAADARSGMETGTVHHKTIPTRRNFVLMMIFPAWDQVLRIDVGNKNWFGAEASKDYPHYVLLFQKVPAAEVTGPLETNVTVIMKSGHLFNLELTSVDKEKRTSANLPKVYDFSGDYGSGAEVKTVALEKPAPPGPSETEKALMDKLAALEAQFEKAVDAKAKDRLFEDLMSSPASGRPTVLAKASDGPLEITIHELRRVDRMTLVGFTVANRSEAPVEILDPQLTLDTLKGKKTWRSRTLTLEKLKIAGKIEPKSTVRGVLAFVSDFERDAHQVVRLSIARKEAADKPIRVTLF